MEQFQPYIFVSYAREDKNRVIPFLKALQQAGYRIWYDAGIQPGEKWNRAIATHIKNCAACLAFISAHSSASKYCDREIQFVDQNEKRIVPLFLDEDVNFEDIGTEMIVTTIQSLKLSDCPSPQDLLERLENQPDFRACKAAARREGQASAHRSRRNRTRDSAPEAAVVPTLAPVTDSGTKKTRKPSPRIRAVYVNGRLAFSDETTQEKPSMANALRLTFETALNDYLGDGSAPNKRGVVEAFIRKHPTFLRFEAVSAAQFVAKKPLALNGFSSPVYLATNNDTQAKRIYVTQLCDFLKAAGQICDVQWLTTDDNASWSWGERTGEIVLLNHVIAVESPPDERP
ncbi:MAG: toll/interleukin-1 receptor domain-containing protein [Oscillibacter sp.]|nr:toll/interleukin-1 receptor domain-containing protein [Oscillibacter sp.]